MTQYITIFKRKDSVMDWDFHVSDTLDQATETFRNLNKQGARPIRTRPIGEPIATLSKDWNDK